jgi:hypothetical protein
MPNTALTLVELIIFNVFFFFCIFVFKQIKLQENAKFYTIQNNFWTNIDSVWDCGISLLFKIIFVWKYIKIIFF